MITQNDAIAKLNKISKTPTISLIDSYLNNESPIDNLYICDSKDSQSELNKLKQTYQTKLKEIDSLYKEILAKDEIISQLNQRNSSSNKTSNSNYPPKRNSQNKKISEIERESNEQLKSDLAKLKDEYNEQIQSISNEHDQKVKHLRNEIQSIKSQIDIYSDSNKYISKEEHEKILNDLKKKHKEELEPFEKEISELEKFIVENYPNVLNQNLINNSLPNLVSNNTGTEDNSYFNVPEGGFTSSLRTPNDNKYTNMTNNQQTENNSEADEIENERQSVDRRLHDIKNFNNQKGHFEH